MSSTIHAQGYRKLIDFNLDSCNRYDSLMWCSKKCHPDSTNHYRGLRDFYLNEIEYYWMFEYGIDNVLNIRLRKSTEGFIPYKCKCN